MSWDRRFVYLAALVAGWSKDPSTKCGAVIVRPDKTVASLGFNGFAKRSTDDTSMYEDRKVKYSRIIHAEMNAILHAREPLQGYTMYTWPGGISPTCDRCAVHVVQAGIVELVHLKAEGDFVDRWREAAESALDIYKDAQVVVRSI